MTIGIVGLGLIGTSVSLAAQRARPDVRIVGLDRGDPLDALHDVDVVVLATPVDVTIDIVRNHTTHLHAPLVIDTGSTKRAILSAAREGALANFVGGHPMAGAASAGPADARSDLFDGKPWFVFADGTSAEAYDRARVFVEMLGAHAVEMRGDGAEHDRLMAAVSHLPQVVASALMVVVGERAGADGLRVAGSGLHDTTRLAASPASMWESVLASNAREIQPLLLKLADDLRAIAHDLDDTTAVRRLFDAANDYRSQLK